MAGFSIDIPDDFLKQLNIETQFETAEKMINEALPIYQNSIKKSLSAHHRNGDLENSVKVKKAKKAKTGAIIGNISFDGYDRKKVANMVKAVALEYGTSKQDATPFLDKSTNDCEQEVLDKMQEIFNEEVGK